MGNELRTESPRIDRGFVRQDGTLTEAAYALLYRLYLRTGGAYGVSSENLALENSFSNGVAATSESAKRIDAAETLYWHGAGESANSAEFGKQISALRNEVAMLPDSTASVAGLGADIKALRVQIATLPDSTAAVAELSRRVSALVGGGISMVDVSAYPGYDPTGATDSTAAFTAAEASGHAIYVPAGTHAINWAPSSRVVVFGEGAGSSIITPFDTSVAAITYKAPPPNWTYASEFRGIEFRGTAKVGVGFAFAQTDPADYVANDEFVNNVKFYGCFWAGLEKGVIFASGNIGTEFYSCGFTGNYYGVYSLDSKFGGVMHAGNKYFYAGQLDNNDCGVYVHNETEGFGGLHFTDTIFEINNINAYVYTNNTFQAVTFSGVWNEGSGVSIGGSTTLDQWSGTTLTTASFTNHAWIFDGTESTYAFQGGGVLCDINLIATQSRVIAERVRCERDSGFGGSSMIVANADSCILLRDPETDGGVQVDTRVLTEGVVNMRSLTPASEAQRRWYMGRHRFSKAVGYGGNKVSQRFTTAVATTGIVLTGTLVSDGVVYTQANEFVVPAGTAGTFATVDLTSVTPASGGWVVFTCNVKWVSGALPSIYFGDLSADQICSAMTVPTTGWHTIIGIAKSNSGAAVSMQLEGNAAASTIRLSAMQAVTRPTRHEAQAFLASGVYIDS